MLAKAKFTMDVSSMIMKKAAPVATTGIQAVKNVECAVATTRWLRSRYALTRAAPIPCDPPVITATFCSLPIGNLLYASEGLVHERRTGCEEPVGLKLCSVDGKRISTIRQTLFRVAIECGSSPACPNAIECLSFLAQYSSLGRNHGPYRCRESLRRGARRGQSSRCGSQARSFACRGQPRYRLPRGARRCPAPASDDAVDQGERGRRALCGRLPSGPDRSRRGRHNGRRRAVGAARHPYLDGPLALGRSGAATDPRRLHGRLPGGVRAASFAR